MGFTGYGYNENCIEWIRDEKRATLSLSQRSVITKIKKYAASHPEECEIVAINKDGSVCAHVPVSWVKISPPKKMSLSEEQRQAFAERMKESRNE